MKRKQATNLISLLFKNIRELHAVRYSFITYIWSKVDLVFFYSVYLPFSRNNKRLFENKHVRLPQQ